MKKGFFKEYALPILAILFFLLSFIWMGTRMTIESNSNSVEDWLPEDYRETLDYKWFLQNFPFESFVVISWDGCTLADENRIEFFAQKLVPSQSIDNFSLLAPTADIRADLNIAKIKNRLQPDVLQNRQNNTDKEIYNDNIDKKDSLDNEVKQKQLSPFKSVMTGPRLIRLLEQSYSKLPQSNMTDSELHEEVISRLKGTLIGPDGKSTAMIVTLEKPESGKRNGKDLKKILDQIRAYSVECGLPNTIDIQTGTAAQRIIRALYDFYKETRYGRQPRLDGVIMGGPPTDNVALDQEGERTLYRLAGICALIGLTVALVCLRSFRLTMFVFWVAIISAGIAMAMVSFTRGTCDSILLSMPALVYVIAMSGSIHLINYYHDAIQEGGLQGATERAVHHAFTPSFFAQFTTAIGLGSLYASHLTPIVKFGFYSALGVLTTLILLFTYLPALLYFYPSRKFAALHGKKGLESNENVFTQFWGYLGGINIKYHTLTTIVCLCIMLFLGFQLRNIQTSVKMMNFFSPDADIIANYSWLEEKLGPLVPMELVISFDNSKLKPTLFGTSDRLLLINQVCDTLKKELQEDIGGTLSVGLFTPDINSIVDPKNIVRYNMVNTVIGKTINNNRDKLKDYLAIEGNPSLDELQIFFQDKVKLGEETLSKRQKDLDVRMKAKSFSLDKTIKELSQEPDVNSKTTPLKQEKTVNPFIQEVRTYLQEVENQARLKQMLDVLTGQKDFLVSSKIDNLKLLQNTISKDRPFHALTLEDTQLLYECTEQWQQEKGIDLWRISIRVWSLKKDIDYSKFINDVKEVVEPILASASEKIEIIINKSEVKSMAESPTEKGSLEELQTKTAEASGLTPSGGAQSKSNINTSMGEGHSLDIIHPVGISAKYTGMVPLVYKTQHELINGLVSSLIWAFVLIALVMLFLYRNPVLSIVSMLPNLFPVVVVFGFMAWKGILVDVGTMMTASVALGVAVDDTIHYLTWFTDNIDKGLDAKEAAKAAYRRCATAMTQSSLISGLGLFAFAFSTFVPTQRFGVMMLAILFVAVLGDLIFLPALLTGPLGRSYVRQRQAKKRKISSESVK